jgi:ATP-dependent protease ClpP protease subunit
MLTVMGGMTSMGLCVQTVGLSGTEHRLANASVYYDQTAHVIRIEGLMGHRFHRDLADALSQHGDAQAVVINSPGGLLDQAFKAAAAIKQAKLPLRVDGECASACGLMWASVPQRQMTASSRIGLHQNHTISDLPTQLTVATTQRMEDESVEVLSSAGFTGDMLRHRAETPPAKMYWLDAVDIMTSGIDAKVLDASGQPVDVATAKWAVLSASWGKGSATGLLYQAIAAHEPSLVDTYEDRLYNALHSKNWPLLRYEDGLLETAALRQALTQVSDQAVMDWTRRRQLDLAEASRRGNQQACDLMTGHAGNEPIDASTRKWVTNHSIARTTLLVDAIPATAQAADAPIATRQAADDFAAYVRGLLAQVKQEGYPADSASWSSMQHCTYANRFLQGLEQMPLASGAEIIRYNEAGWHAH